MLRINLTEEELNKLKVLADFLFFDEYQDKASFPQFEKSFAIFFTEKQISLEKVFKELCGPKKKFVTFQRLIKAFLHFKNSPNQISLDTKNFFSHLLKNVIKDLETTIGRTEEGRIFTSANNKKRDFISEFHLMTDEKDIIKGFKLEYDDSAKAYLFKKNDKKLKEKFAVELLMLNEILDESIKAKIDCRNEFMFRDSITHIFGTFSDKIEFLGIMTRSGKSSCFGVPKGDCFMFGHPNTQLHYMKITVSDQGISYFEPHFIPTPRGNSNLSIQLAEITNDYLEKDELINEEEDLANLENPEALEKYISAAPVVKDNKFNEYKNEIKENEMDLRNFSQKEQKEWNKNESDSKYSGLNDEEEIEEIVNKNLRTGKKSSKNTNKSEKDENTKSKGDSDEHWNGISMKNEESRKFIGNKKNYKNLMNKLGDDIKFQLELEKKKEEQEKKKNTNFYDRYLKNHAGFIGDALLSQRHVENVDDLQKKFKNVKDEEYDKKTEKEREKNETKRSDLNVISTTKNQTIVYKPPPEIKENDFYMKDYFGEENKQSINEIPENEEEEENDGENRKLPSKKNYDPSMIRIVPKDIKFIKAAQENWINLAESLNKKSGRNILHTIGAVIKAISTLNHIEDEMYSHSIPLEDKINLYHTLDKNFEIVEFLARAKKKDKSKKSNQKAGQNEEDLDFAEGLSYNEIQKMNIDQLNKAIKQIETKQHQKVKNEFTNYLLNKLYNSCIKRKNELLVLQEKNLKKEMIKAEKIDKEAYIRQEGEKRKIAKKEKRDLLSEFLAKINDDPMYNRKRKKNKLAIKEDVNPENEEEISKPFEEKGAKKKNTNKYNNSKYNNISAIVANTPETDKVYKKQKPPKSKDFKDTEYPPSSESIYTSDEQGNVLLPKGVNPEDVQNIENIEWAKSKEIYPEYEIFSEKDSKLIQGYLDNPQFISAISILKKYPEFIKKLFYTRTISDFMSDGYYGIYLLINGIWKLVILDDYFPYEGRFSKRIAYSRTEENELWLPLLEKAWSKIHGSYLSSAGFNQLNDPFDFLTEAYTERIPIINLNNTSKEDQWLYIISCLREKYFLTASASEKSKGINYGISPYHPYSIAEAYDLNDNIRLMKLVYHLGQNKWNGDWSANSNLWKPEIKEAVNYYRETDNSFYISYDDFCKYFSVLAITHFHKDYLYNSIKVPKEKASYLYPTFTKVVVSDNNADVYFRIHQKNPSLKKDYQETVLQYIMLLDENFNYLMSETNAEISTCIRMQNLKKGTYYLVSDINYKYLNREEETHSYVVSSYSNVNINLVEYELDESKIMEIIKKASSQLVYKIYKGEISEGIINLLDENNKEKLSPKNPDAASGGRVNVYFSKQLSHRIPYQIYLFENVTNTESLVDITINCKGTKSFAIYCNEEGEELNSEITINVPANSQKALLVMKYFVDSKFFVSYKVCCDGGFDSKPNYRGGNKGKKSDDSAPVFETEPNSLDDEGLINQYFLEERNGYSIGIENNSDEDIRMRLNLSGLIITDKEFLNQNVAKFDLDKQTKKVFAVTYVPKYDGELSFKFTEI